MITTTHGPMDESLLEKREGGFEDEHEKTTWVEYYMGDELVHRSAHVVIKEPATFGTGKTQTIG